MDIWIVVLYIAVLLGIGLFGGREVKTADGFTATDKTYGAPIIFMSMAASFIGGGFSAGNAAAAFENGIGMTVALLGFSTATILTGMFLTSGIARFRGAWSVGDIMAQSYGRRAGILTGFFSFLTSAGVVGAQVEGMGGILHTLLGIPPTVGVLIGVAVVLIYSTVGGLRSVIAADVVQFALLAIGMPLLLTCAVTKAGGVGTVIAATPTALFNPLNERSVLSLFSLIATFACGELLAPPYTQRLLIGKNLKAAARGTVAGGIFSIPFFFITFFIGLAARTLRVTAIPADAMPALINTILPVGIRGIVMASLVSMLLSAADGFLNGAAVGLIHDTLRPLHIVSADKELTALRLTNALTGVAATAAALLLPDIFVILKLAYTFWCPLIVPPLIYALRGNPTHPRAFRTGLAGGLLTVMLWDVLLGAPFGVAGAPLGFAVNFLLLSAVTKRIERKTVFVSFGK
ncbi:MAG: sodium:solute symporter family protein [Clostridia bacterium]|nr:sodium:solute symporter family protein [Clostridia bacterium]